MLKVWQGAILSLFLRKRLIDRARVTWKPIIDQWLAENLKMRFKQHYNAKRIHARLRKEHPDEYDCSYPLDQRFVKQRKTTKRQPEGYLELVWL